MVVWRPPWGNKRRGEKCKASHKKETVSNGTCELYTKAADNIHPDNPMSAKVETENNAGNNISSLGHSTGPRPLAHQSSARVQAWSKSVGIFPQDPRELQAQAGLRVGETFKVSCESCTSQQTSVMLNWKGRWDVANQSSSMMAISPIDLRKESAIIQVFLS